MQNDSMNDGGLNDGNTLVRRSMEAEDAGPLRVRDLQPLAALDSTPEDIAEACEDLANDPVWTAELTPFSGETRSSISRGRWGARTSRTLGLRPHKINPSHCGFSKLRRLGPGCGGNL